MGKKIDPNKTELSSAKKGLIPTNISEDIIEEMLKNSAYMQLVKGKRMKTTTTETEFDHMAEVGDYWKDGFKRTKVLKPTVIKRKMIHGKIETTILLSKDDLNSTVASFFEKMKEEVGKALAEEFDCNVFSNFLNKHSIETIEETNNKYDDINIAMSRVERNDMTPNGIVSHNAQKIKYRNTKNKNGELFFAPDTKGLNDKIMGLPTTWVKKRCFKDGEVCEIVGNWNNAYYGILEDIKYEVLREASLSTVKDEAGNPLSLAERDIAALKVTMHIGFMVAKENAFAVIIKDKKA